MLKNIVGVPMGFRDYLINIGRKKRGAEPIVEEQLVVPGKVRVCNSCSGSITPDQKYTKQIGYYFHRKCWKAEKKAANL